VEDYLSTAYAPPASVFILKVEQLVQQQGGAHSVTVTAPHCRHAGDTSHSVTCSAWGGVSWDLRMQDKALQCWCCLRRRP
jgi:hypothetical protein